MPAFRVELAVTILRTVEVEAMNKMEAERIAAEEAEVDLPDVESAWALAVEALDRSLRH